MTGIGHWPIRDSPVYHQPVLHLQGGYIFLKKIFNLFSSQHFINDAKNGLFVIFIEFLNETHLFVDGFVGDKHLFWRYVFGIEQFINGNTVYFCQFLELTSCQNRGVKSDIIHCDS